MSKLSGHFQVIASQELEMFLQIGEKQLKDPYISFTLQTAKHILLL